MRGPEARASLTSVNLPLTPLPKSAVVKEQMWLWGPTNIYVLGQFPDKEEL